MFDFLLVVFTIFFKSLFDSLCVLIIKKGVKKASFYSAQTKNSHYKNKILKKIILLTQISACFFPNRNFMNDSLRTDVFVRYPPETIAVACIYLSARKLNVPLPKNPSWFDVLDVEEDDIKACCYRMICLYTHKKSNQDELEATIGNY